MNIDRQSRLEYAELLRHFTAGRMTNDEYEEAAERLIDSRDASLWAIWRAVWFHYDDLKTHRLAGKWKLLPETRHDFARAIVFLHSDLPYEWPSVPFWRMVLGLLTLGIATRLFPIRSRGGDESVWPFFRREDFETAINHPRLLGGVN